MADDPDEGPGTSTTPDQRDARPSTSRSRSGSDGLEATELSQIRTQYSQTSNSYRRDGRKLNSQNPPPGFGKLKYAITKFWNNQISVIVPHEACRDHLGTYAVQSLSVSTAFLYYMQQY
jgi:hypothetical protein